MDLDPVFLPYSQVNGVPQESKLATYMKRPTGGGGDGLGAGVTNSATKSMSSMSLESMKKVLAQAAEFVPRNNVSTFASRLTDSSTVSPQMQTNTPSPTQNILHPTPHAMLEKNLPTYQENFGGTTYFYQAPGSINSSEVSSTAAAAVSDELVQSNVLTSSPGFTMHPGTPSHIRNKAPNIPLDVASSFYMSENVRQEIQHKNALTIVSANPDILPGLPLEVDNYCDLVPLEQIPTGIKPLDMIGYLTSTFKATHLKSGSRYCLRRVHNFRVHNTKCMIFVEMWKKLAHSNIVQLREVFTTKAFGDHSMVFVYDYHANSETLMSKHFSSTEPMNSYTDGFSSNPLAPRPYSHSKNTLLRQQHSSFLPESIIWSYIIQLTGALRVIHSAGLACRCLDPSKVLLTGPGRSRLRISGVCINDVISFDPTTSNPLSIISVCQQDDLTALGKLILAMACGSMIALQRENLQTSIELMARSYSMDLRNLVIYLLSTHTKRSVVDLMPMIGARYYTQLDAVQMHSDCLENELAKEMENGRLFRLLTKLGTINERPELNMDTTWSETGDRYMLKLFRDYLMHQVQEDGRPWLDMSHVVHCLNKLDAGTQEKICLMSRDEQSILVVSYAELKQCLDQSFLELSSAAALTPKSQLTL